VLFYPFKKRFNIPSMFIELSLIELSQSPSIENYLVRKIKIFERRLLILIPLFERIYIYTNS